MDPRRREDRIVRMEEFTMSTQQEEMAEWWTLKQVANRFGCSEMTVLRKIKSGELRGKKIGGWKVHRSALEAFESDAKVKERVPHRGRVRDTLGLYRD